MFSIGLKPIQMGPQRNPMVSIVTFNKTKLQHRLCGNIVSKKKRLCGNILIFFSEDSLVLIKYWYKISLYDKAFPYIKLVYTLELSVVP